MEEAGYPLFQRNDEFWYPDGNVILVAGTAGFKVYRGQLSNHSDVFRDMLEIPQPNEVEEIEGCPVVQLHDQPRDLVFLLRVLFPGALTCLQLIGRPQFSAVSAWVRLGDKYHITSLRDQGLKWLKEGFTGDLPASFTTVEEYLKSASIHMELRDALAVVYLARLTDTQSLLPLVFYMCCQLEPADILQRVTANVVHEQMSPSDAATCIQGATLLSGATAHAYIRILSPDAETTYKFRAVGNCANQGRCRNKRDKLLHDVSGELVALRDQGITSSAALDDWSVFLEKMGQEPDSMCVACKELARLTSLEERASIWQQLPGYFGLPGMNLLSCPMDRCTGGGPHQLGPTSPMSAL
ncbi:hypothetical protein CERSUDRAFT_97472 [Gelatoporia subvermispora B]|uniref:BTB domain-containing protein n=1 Tax=Ceriporiopsis subvermispora (strain B) TaxID=914234 RepID=M2R739_CERS8|nr:hypothetical protein CERSUDRAFT_97472 [Gelatoporia subvermispora B]